MAPENKKFYVKTHDKPFTLFSHGSGPNPWKVAIILEALGLEYHSEYLTFGASDVTLLSKRVLKGDMKQEPFITINPNGRVPALIDHNNNDYAIFESGAIVLYLVEKYDTEHTISFKTLEEKGQAWQWLMLQMSGQGPYYGQAFWFSNYHSEKIPSAIERYVNEINRHLSILEAYFASGESKQWLVSNTLSYADLSFIPWNWAMARIPQLEGWEKKYPLVADWNKRLNDIPYVKAAKEKRTAAIAASQ
ncbi:hypothetical protein RUND412_009575 [Rhizina undulata]